MRYFFLLLAFAAQTAYGQCCPYLSPVQVLPLNPSPTDNIRLVFRATTGGQGSKVSSSFTRIGSNLAFQGCYADGALAQPKSYTDTVSIGQLAAGSYSVSFVGIISVSNQQCIEFQRNTSSMAFQVGGVLATQPGSSTGWAVYPVPASSRSLSLVVPADEILSTIQLLDVTGRESFACPATKLLRQSGHWTLELPELAQGAYNLRITLANGRQVMRRVVLQ